MQILTRDQVLKLLGLTRGGFDQLQHAGHVALAFGSPLPARPGRYFELDLVAIAINLGLAQSLGREMSTAIVAGFFHQWAAAVGYAEADPSDDFFLAVGGVDWDDAKKGPTSLIVTNGTFDQIKRDFGELKDLAGFFTVNVSDIIRRLRIKAQAAGINLSGPFFFAPDDPRFEQILTQVKREWEARIARVRQDKKKLAVAKRHRRHANIAEPSRVKDVNYPPVMREILAATTIAR
jgi:hypothetical protein